MLCIALKAMRHILRISRCGWNGMGMHQQWYRMCPYVGGAHSICDKGALVYLI